MAIDFRTPDEIADEYLLTLSGLRPDVNVDQTDSDWYVRGKVVGGVVAGLYADQRLIANDAFVQRARREAVGNFLEMFLNDTFRAAQPAEGFALVHGTIGTPVSAGLQFLYEPNGNTYQASSGIVLAATAALVPIVSISTGQNQNLISGAPLLISSPPAGIDPSASASGNISDGRDAETVAEGAARVLDRIRNPISGGTEADYRQWAVESNASVVGANVLRYPFGFGTVGVVVSAGTTDIDTALDNGQPISLIPSEALIEIVAAYLETKRPIDDCVTVFAPSGIDVDVTIRVSLTQGSLSSIPAGQSLTQEALIQREVKRAIYKTPPGGRRIGGEGYVLASEIEEVVDIGLADSPYVSGKLPILTDRKVDDLSISSPNYQLLPTQIALPGTITVELL